MTTCALSFRYQPKSVDQEVVGCSIWNNKKNSAMSCMLTVCLISHLVQDPCLTVNALTIIYSLRHSGSSSRSVVCHSRTLMHSNSFSSCSSLIPLLFTLKWKRRVRASYCQVYLQCRCARVALLCCSTQTHSYNLSTFSLTKHLYK